MICRKNHSYSKCANSDSCLLFMQHPFVLFINAAGASSSHSFLQRAIEKRSYLRGFGQYSARRITRAPGFEKGQTLNQETPARLRQRRRVQHSTLSLPLSLSVVDRSRPCLTSCCCCCRCFAALFLLKREYIPGNQNRLPLSQSPPRSSTFSHTYTSTYVRALHSVNGKAL